MLDTSHINVNMIVGYTIISRPYKNLTNLYNLIIVQVWHTRTHARTHTQTNTCIHMQTHARMHARMHTRAHTHTRTPTVLAHRVVECWYEGNQLSSRGSLTTLEETHHELTVPTLRRTGPDILSEYISTILSTVYTIVVLSQYYYINKLHLHIHKSMSLLKVIYIKW